MMMTQPEPSPLERLAREVRRLRLEWAEAWPTERGVALTPATQAKAFIAKTRLEYALNAYFDASERLRDG